MFAELEPVRVIETGFDENGLATGYTYAQTDNIPDSVIFELAPPTYFKERYAKKGATDYDVLHNIIDSVKTPLPDFVLNACVNLFTRGDIAELEQQNSKHDGRGCKLESHIQSVKSHSSSDNHGGPIATDCGSQLTELHGSELPAERNSKSQRHF